MHEFTWIIKNLDYKKQPGYYFSSFTALDTWNQIRTK